MSGVAAIVVEDEEEETWDWRRTRFLSSRTTCCFSFSSCCSALMGGSAALSFLFLARAAAFSAAFHSACSVASRRRLASRVSRRNVAAFSWLPDDNKEGLMGELEDVAPGTEGSAMGPTRGVAKGRRFLPLRGGREGTPVGGEEEDDVPAALIDIN